MVKLQAHALTILFIVVLALSLCQFNQQFPVARAADSSTLTIVNIQTLNSSNQRNFYFCRGIDLVEFNVSVTNEGSSVASGQLTITVLDNSRVPIEYLQSQVFSVNPGQLETVQVVSDIVPTYAFVGIATAQVAIRRSINRLSVIL